MRRKEHGRKLRIWLMGIALALGLSVLLEHPLSAQKETIVYLASSGYAVDYFIKENKRFEEKYPNIKVTMVTAPFAEQKTKIAMDQATGGGGYDIFVIDCVDVARYAAAGWAIDVTDRITPEMREDITEFAKEGMMYQGRWYGLPAISEWHSFVYNERMLKDAGFSHPPFTWDDFVEQCLKLKENGITEYPYAGWWELDEGITCEFVTLAHSFGGGFFDQDLNPIFDKGGAVEALIFMNDMLNKYKIMPPGSLTMSLTEADNLQAAGKIAFRIRWGIPTISLDIPEKSKIVGESRVGLIPSYDGYHSASCSGPMGMSILSGAKHEDAAWKYVKFRYGIEGSKREALEVGHVPGWKSLYSDPDILKLARDLDRMFLQTKFVVNRPRVPWYEEFSVMLREELHNCLTGQKSAEKALSDAVKKTLPIKREYEGT